MKPEISQVSVTYNQEGNTLGTTSDTETLTVNLEFQESEAEGCFVVLKTEGWSIDDSKDLIELIERPKKILRESPTIPIIKPIIKPKRVIRRNRDI
jgi:hypothetical protein